MSAFFALQNQMMSTEANISLTSRVTTPSHSLTANTSTAHSRSGEGSREKTDANESRAPALLQPHKVRPPMYQVPPAATATTSAGSGSGSATATQPRKAPAPRRSERSGSTSAATAKSRSASVSSQDSDEDYVYVLDPVKTTAEAVQRIRVVQQPPERSLTAFIAAGLGASSTTGGELQDRGARRYLSVSPPATAHLQSSSTTTLVQKMKGGLPATMEEFYECPRYTVSLTAAREAVFADALSGFHSYVQREQEQAAQLRALRQQHLNQHHQHTTHAPHKQKHKRQGSSATVPSFAAANTEEWGTALAATRPQPPSVASTKKLITPSTSAPSHPTANLRSCAKNGAGASPGAVTSSCTPLDATDNAASLATPPSSNATAAAITAGGAPPLSTSRQPSTGETDGLSYAGEGTMSSVLTVETANNSGVTTATTSVAEVSPSAAAEPASGVEGGDGDMSRPCTSLNASYMFIVRSRDTEAMSPLSAPRQAPSMPSIDLDQQATTTPALPQKASAAPLAKDAAAVAAPSPGESHIDPSTSTAAVVAPLPPPPPAVTSPTGMAPEKLEAMQLHTLLQERLFQRARVPVVFRCRYSQEFTETPEEVRERVQMRERVLRQHERIAGPGGLSHAQRQEIRNRYADPNTVPLEWPYVWEQFVRDLPRETLFIGDTPYQDADDALAAIASYMEYCYDRGQAHIQARTAQVLAEAKGESSNSSPTEKGGEQTMTPTAAPAKAAAPVKEKGFFQSLVSAGSAAIKEAVVTVRASLPDFVGDPLLSLSGLDPALYHAALLFPTDPRARSEKIFTAVREVVLASQQSFMGFPYQLLCEQVGTERLGLALEALELEAAADVEDDAEYDTPTEESRALLPATSAPIPLPRSARQDSEEPQELRSFPLRSVPPESRVLRIYQSVPSTTFSEKPESRRRRGHTPRLLDSCEVSSSSASSLTSDVMSLPIFPEAASITEPPPQSQQAAVSAPQPLDALPSTEHPSELMSASAPAMSARQVHRRQRVAQHRRERRRARRSQLPLLVGEPRPQEFAAFLDLLRTKVTAKEAKEKRRPQPHKAGKPSIISELQPKESTRNSKASVEAAVQALDTTTSVRHWFREDVEGSAYLLPTQLPSKGSTDTLSPLSPITSSFARSSLPPEARGMRICVFFNAARNVPVVLVNKVFRLFTVPGLRGFSSSSEAEKEEVVAADGQLLAGVDRPQRGPDQSLLLLIQVQFSLFTKEEAEVRWKWWKV